MGTSAKEIGVDFSFKKSFFPFCCLFHFPLLTLNFHRLKRQPKTLTLQSRQRPQPYKCFFSQRSVSSHMAGVYSCFTPG